jgi:cytidylate kinase
MTVRVITISGEVASGKSSVAAELQRMLPGWKRINTGQRFRDFCESKGMSIQQVSEIDAEIHQEFDATQKALIEHETRAIIEGRLAGWLGREVADAYRVFCFADFDVRVRRYMDRDQASLDQAEEDIKERDAKDVVKFRNVYGIEDYRNPVFYSLMLDTTKMSARELANIIIRNAELQPA